MVLLTMMIPLLAQKCTRQYSHDYNEYSSGDGNDSCLDEEMSCSSFVSGDNTPLQKCPDVLKLEQVSGHVSDDSAKLHINEQRGNSNEQSLPSSSERPTTLPLRGPSLRESSSIRTASQNDKKPWDDDYDEPPEETPDDFFSKDDVIGDLRLKGSFRGQIAPPPLPQHKTSTVVSIRSYIHKYMGWGL